MADGMTIGQLQDYIRDRDHRPEARDVYFLKLVEETGELAEMLIRGRRMKNGSIEGTLEEELYDVLYYIVALANLYGVDLEECFRLKEEINRGRYERNVST